ncbi:hypothetical protein ACHAQF_004148 [Verticillium nonalfalfae]
MSAVPFKVKALYEYSSPHDDDLQFPPGVIITVTEEEDDDWYVGEYVDDAGAKHEGIFPRNFVEKYEPQAPPRPVRSRTKKENEPPAAAPSEPAAAASLPASAHAPVPAPVQEPEPQSTRQSEPEAPRDVPVTEEKPERAYGIPEPAPIAIPLSSKEPVAPVDGTVQSPKEITENLPESTAAATTEPVPAPPVPKAAEHAASSSPPAAKPVPAQAKPSSGPPVSNKPSSNAFKDRIAAFNKSAPPPAPFKPSGIGAAGSAFIKKPFVAPPPSRNAYIPPPQQAPTTKVYRREEDPEIKEQEAETHDNAEKAGFSTSNDQDDGDSDQPKPTSLKERIALLQKQQMEQAQRHAESVTKKEKPKRPAKTRTESHDAPEALTEGPDVTSPVLEGPGADDVGARTSIDSDRLPPPPRRKSSKGPVESYHDGNEADMSGAGDTTEGQEDLTEREDSDERPRRMSRVPTNPGPVPPPRASIDKTAVKDDADVVEEEAADEEEEDDDEDIDPEARRKEELRARMAKMSGGMGMMGMHSLFGGPAPASAPPKKKKADKQHAEEAEEAASPISAAPPVPVPGMMALPGMSAPHRVSEPTETEEPQLPRSPTSPRAPPPPPARPTGDDEEEDDAPPPPSTSRPLSQGSAGPPPIPGGRPAPPPVPVEARPVPAPPPALASQSEGSESGDEMSGALHDATRSDISGPAARSPPVAPTSPISARPPPIVPISGDETSSSPPMAMAPPAPSKRNSRPPPPIPGAAPAVPAGQTRPPPPPPPGGPLSRQSTLDTSSAVPLSSGRHVEADDEEVTEYEGDYDTDIASSAPHKDALKSHARDSSIEDVTPVRSPATDAPPPSFPPPIPTGTAPRAVPPPVPTQAPQAPPPVPSQAPQPPPADKRRSVDVPRAAPPPPPPGKEAATPSHDEEYDPYNYSAPPRTSTYGQRTPKIEEEAYYQSPPPLPSPGPQTRAPPPAPPANRAPGRQSLDVSRPSVNIRRSIDAHRPSMESGFIANDIDLATQSGWWRQAKQVPPVLQGRRDLYYESDETTSNHQGATIVTRTIYVLFQDYSQTIITVAFDPNDQSDVEAEQRHEPPPRALRQDQLEQAYERYGRVIANAVTSKKDSVIGDGTPQALVHELLRPFQDVLLPVGTRGYGALVYSNLANASTQQFDEIRAGDIVSIRNAKFQGKHGPMHAKYTAEVGKPDHVGVVAEWDGTKKKVRAWEQGRENKKVKMESFKLDDLRSGEVKVWRVMPRSWVGWT